MLKIKHALTRLMKLLRSINPHITLPEALESILELEMEEIYPKHHEVLEHEGDVPYYIIRGCVYIYYYDAAGKQHVTRFYREDRIVAFLSFLEGTEALYTIAAGRDTILSRVSQRTMKKIYGSFDGMYEFAQLTVMRYDESKEKMKSDILGLPAPERVKLFYELYPFLLPAEAARMDEEIANLLLMSVRNLRKFR